MLKNLAYFLFEETLWLCGPMPSTRRRIASGHDHRYGVS